MNRFLPSASLATLLLSAAHTSVLAQDDDIPFSACGLIGAYYPTPNTSYSSQTAMKIRSDLTETFDDLIQQGFSEKYGEIYNETTSFSVVLFSGSEDMSENPVLFEYHYTSPKDAETVEEDLTADTRVPMGDLSMILTVYTWLVNKGDEWETPITDFLPELADVKGSLSVPWKDVTIGALAGQMSGLSRQSEACTISESCSWEDFKDDFAERLPLFLPDTTPVISYAAFQLIAFALQKESGQDWESILEDSLIEPLGLSSTGLLGGDESDIFISDGVDFKQVGEPAALSVVSTLNDLARAGHSMLASTLVSPAITRRWLHPNMDTSNLRNGVGRPWEVYRAGSTPISPVLDVLTKAGSLGKYASYFGLTPDFNAGFAIVAHDSTAVDRKLDVNVHADIVSEALGYLQVFAERETTAGIAGVYTKGKDNNTVVQLNVTNNGPGVEVEKLIIDETDLKAETAKKLGIKKGDLDFRLYPTNVKDEKSHRFVAVFQDRSAPIDMGTPTCITWQEVGDIVGDSFNVIFKLDKSGRYTGLEVPKAGGLLKKTD